MPGLDHSTIAATTIDCSRCAEYHQNKHGIMQLTASAGCVPAAMNIGRHIPRRILVKVTFAAIGATVCAATSANAAAGDQTIVKDLVATKGWTAVIPLNLNGDSLTDMLSYNAN